MGAGEGAPRRRHDLDTLGLLLLGGVSLAWLTCVPYLLVRFGAGLPFRLVLVDGLHCYVGLVTSVILSAKVRRGGRRRTVPGVPDMSLWDRLVSMSMAILYSAVMVTGMAALLPLGADTRTALVNAHLLAGVWAAAPTTWHVVTHRGRLGATASRLRLRLRDGGWARAALLPVLAVPLVLSAPALAPLTQAHAGLTWQPRGPQVLLDRLEVAPDGRTIVAAGEGLFVSSDGQRWRGVGGFGGPSSRRLVLGLRLTDSATYVGTTDGLYVAPRPSGPYHLMRSPAKEVHGVEVVPGGAPVVWVAAYNGVWMSRDGGVHWAAEDAGLAPGGGAWALRFFRGVLFVSDSRSVDRWDGYRWVLSDPQANVDALDTSADGRELFASSMGQGLAVFDGHSWHTANVGLGEHAHDGLSGVHVDSVTDVGAGTVYAGTMVSGIAESGDGARTWSRVWTALRGDVWRVRVFGGEILAATDFGLLTYGPLPPAPSAGAVWWLYVLAASAAAGVAAVGLARPRR